MYYFNYSRWLIIKAVEDHCQEWWTLGVKNTKWSTIGVGGIILSEVTDGNSNYDTINAKWNNYKLNHNINIEPKLYPMPFKENPIDNSNYTKTLEILNKQIDGYFLIYAEFNTEVFNRE